MLCACFFFLNYFAVNTLEVQHAYEVIKGIAEGCVEARCTLLSSETAEMPGVFNSGQYGISGFAVGAVERGCMVKRKKVLKTIAGKST